jgi:hypothetical protein
MRDPTWKRTMEDLLDGVERELRSFSVPSRTRLGLSAFRTRLRAGRVVGGRKRFEQELEAFIESNSLVRAAAVLYLQSIMVPAVEAANAALKKAEKALARIKAGIRLV